MRFFKPLLILLLIIILLPARGWAEPSVSASSAILIEKDSGRVIFEKSSKKQMPMASTTKIMTAICAIENCDNIDKEIEIPPSAAGVEGSSMYLQAGEKMTIRELLYGLMLSSGNDAAVAIGESIAGSIDAFVELMNKKAVEIGANNTHFANPNGLPNQEHYSTAEDMAKITAYGMSNSAFADIVSTKSYKIQGEGKAYPRVLSNHNKLLSMYEGCIGVKTGFTKAAGRCLVSGAERNGMTLICVTLNAPDDWNDHKEMFDYGFEKYNMTTLRSCEEPLCAAEVLGSKAGAVPVYLSKDVCYPMCEGEGYQKEVQLYPSVSAPLKAGEEVGDVVFEIKTKSGEIIKIKEKAVVKGDVDALSVVDKIKMNFGENLKLFLAEWLGFFVS